MRAEIAAIFSGDQTVPGIAAGTTGLGNRARSMARYRCRGRAPELWSDPGRAQAVLRARRRLARSGKAAVRSRRRWRIWEALAELGAEEADAETEDEAERELAALRRTRERQEMEALLSGEMDGNDGILESTPVPEEPSLRLGAKCWCECTRAGRSDAAMHWRQSRRRAGRRAGIRSATLCVKGDDAYGWLKTEAGVHRPGAHVSL